MTKTVRILLLSACFAGTLAAQSHPRLTLELPRRSGLLLNLEDKTGYFFWMDSTWTLVIIREAVRKVATERFATPRLCRFDASGLMSDDSLARYCPDSAMVRSAKFPELGWIVIHGPTLQHDRNLEWPHPSHITLDQPFLSRRVVGIDVSKLYCAIPNPEDCL